MSVNLKPLTTFPFLVCLFLLLLNDLYLKIIFHNSLTGKLSDVCGLFIFPIFWSVLFPKRKFAIYLLTCLFFIYWKSSYSETFINLFSCYIFPVQRTIDLTDLFALLVLPFSWYLYAIAQRKTYFNAPLAGLITLFSFCATSMPRQLLRFEQPQYVLFNSTDHLIDSNFVDQGFKFHPFDHLLAVEIDYMELNRESVKDDDFNKNLYLRDLDQKVLKELPGQSKIIPPNQINKLKIHTNNYEDDVVFKGSRLHGKFLRKSKDQILIDGQFKNGIADSVWTFTDPSLNTSIKRTFKNGETTLIEEFKFSKLASSKSINTRQQTRIFKGLHLAILLLFCIAIVIKLRKNHKTKEPLSPDIKILYKSLLSISLPFLTWLIQLIICAVIPDHYSDFFNEIYNFLLIYAIGLPVFMIILFGFKPRRWTDVLWYCLLFSLLFVFWRETVTLSLLLEN